MGLKTGNPRGRPPLPTDLFAVKCRSKSEIKRLLNIYMDFPASQLQSKLDDPKTPAIELFLARILARGIETADWKMFSFLLDRIVGPVKTEDIDVNRLRAQIEAEIKLEAMTIEEVRALALRASTIDVGDDDT